MNWFASSGEQASAETQAVQPATAARTAVQTSESAQDWLCASCYGGVAKDDDRFQYSGQDEFAFTNPDGFRFEIITFSETQCVETGVPTLEHTWFPGHAWSYCLCGKCGQHLGWQYSGTHVFAGLIRDRLVRAACLRN